MKKLSGQKRLFRQGVIEDKTNPQKEKPDMIKTNVNLTKEEKEVVDSLALISVLAESTAKKIIKSSLSKSKEAQKDGKK